MYVCMLACMYVCMYVCAHVDYVDIGQVVGKKEGRTTRCSRW